MKMNNQNNQEMTIKVATEEQKKAIQKRIINLEKYNYNQKEFTGNEMVNKIKRIIEEEVLR